MAKTPPLLTAGQLAKRVGMAPATIAVWRGKGMPTAGRNAKGFLYDEAACVAWRAANASGGSDGGKRPGAGRKPKGFTGATVKTEPAAVTITPDSATPGTRAFAEREKAAWSAKEAELRVRKRLSEIIEVTEAIRSIRELVGCFSRMVHGSAGKTAAGLVALGELDASALIKFKAYLEREADENYERLMADVRRTLGALVPKDADIGLPAGDGNRSGPTDQAAPH